MILKMYSIRDSKGEIFNPPFYSKTHGEAERSFRTLATDSKSTIFQYPEDFDLYQIGTYDPDSGEVKQTEQPKFVISALTMKAAEENRIIKENERRQKIQEFISKEMDIKS